MDARRILNAADLNGLRMTLSFTLKVDEWRGLQGQLPTAWPSTSFGHLVKKALKELDEAANKLTVLEKVEPY